MIDLSLSQIDSQRSHSIEIISKHLALKYIIRAVPGDNKDSMGSDVNSNKYNLNILYLLSQLSGRSQDKSLASS